MNSNNHQAPETNNEIDPMEPVEGAHVSDEFHQEHSADEEKKKENKPNPHLEAFLTELEKQKDPDLKLQMTIDFMESSISQQSGTPRFKSFWDLRNICLELFKGPVSPLLRAHLWTKYTELTKEARRLKEVLDEQSVFAAEQIEIAIQGIEQEIEHIQDSVAKMNDFSFEINPQSFAKELIEYAKVQKELNLLNAYATRVNALRKELIRTEMRIRQKNKFFQRLSAAGDRIFPRRKELIKEISDKFVQDVDAFIQAHFGKENLTDSLFFLREEIKALQGLAKLLTLNTHSFTHTRMRLSECWDKIKTLDKERKKERFEQKSLFKQNSEAVLEKIKATKEGFEKQELSVNDANNQLDEILSSMRNVQLGREEVKMLRDEIETVRKPLMEKIRAATEERQQHERERERLKRKKLDDLKLEVETLVANAQSYESEKLIEARDEVVNKIASSGIAKMEKNELERLLKPLRDIISEKKEQALMSLSEDVRNSLEQFKEVLRQRKERRQEIKNQLETYRKAHAASGFDIEKAMQYNELIHAEKERLDKINQGIREIEDKIDELRS